MTLILGVYPLLTRNSKFNLYASIMLLRIEAGNRHCNDGVCFIVINHKKTYVVIKQHEVEIPRTVVLHDTCVLVGKDAKTEDVCNKFIVYVVGEGRSWFVNVLDGDKAWHDVLMYAWGMGRARKGRCIHQ
jgi:hypothetical protein